MPQPKAPQSRTKAKSASRKSILQRLDSLSPGEPPTKKQKTKPLISVLKPPLFDLSGSQPETGSQSRQDARGKGKGKLESFPLEQAERADGRMWIDVYEPRTEEELAVHKRKIQDVRHWLLEAFDGGPSGNLKKYRRILVLTGPAGTAKTATIRVLAQELSFEILEWRNSRDETFSHDADWNDQMDYESLSQKFQNFLTRASSYRPVLGGPNELSRQTNVPSSQPSSASKKLLEPSNPPVSEVTQRTRHIILLEDLPNILHHGTQEAFHSAIDAFLARPATNNMPLVIIVSDAGVRGEGAEDAPNSSMRRGKEVVDARSVLPPHLLFSPYVTQISFNPIAPTFLRRALQDLVKDYYGHNPGTQPSKELIDVIVESANGDIRSAIMALQFTCLGDKATNTAKRAKGSRKGAGGSARAVLESVTRREQSLALFHLLGKLMYNKRKGDPPNASASARDVQREKVADVLIPDPPPLPEHLSEHERRASRVDVEMLYADSPIDASLLSLYVQQNYTQYCDILEQCDAEAELLSWIDSSGGELWYQANPHRFHVLALGTLHALPSPVTRRNQKSYKPAFFEALQHEREAENGIHDVQVWLRNDGAGLRWSQREILLELGAVLGARDSLGTDTHAPPSHRRFSKLDFKSDSIGRVQLEEEEGVIQDSGFLEDEDKYQRLNHEQDVSEQGGWLEGDDIEDF